METPREFIERYIQARTAENTHEFQMRSEFRRPYFAEGCRWDSRDGIAETSAQERVSEVVMTGEGAAVKSILAEPMPVILYHLRSKGDSWEIFQVQYECLNCRGKVLDGVCEWCGGTGWATQGR